MLGLGGVGYRGTDVEGVTSEGRTLELAAD
jgi:hypothetical protein